MKKLLFIVSLVLFSIPSFAQTIYSKTYGNSKNPAVIFIHGGPSGNSNLFEGTTAETLANTGFYVIVYDRRGEGRSKDENAAMTFDESFNDLNQIYKTYKISKANILAHSFGGIAATLYTAEFPEKVSSLILAGALFSQQETYDHILKNAAAYFKNDTSKLSQIKKIENLNKSNAEYRKGCYDIASEMNYFVMPNPTKESTALRNQYEKSIFYKTAVKNAESPIKFYKNESKNNIDTKSILLEIKAQKIPVYAIYGKNDGIFSDKQLKDMQQITGKNNFKILDNCSHYLFVDQQNDFINFVSNKLKNKG